MNSSGEMNIHLLSPCSHRQPLSTPLTTNGNDSSPLIMIQNYCGAKLSVSLCVYPQRLPNSPKLLGSPRVSLSEIEIFPQTQAQIHTPWDLISGKYGDSIFPMLMFSVTLITGNAHQDYFRLHYLHSLSTEKIFIPLIQSETTPPR